MPLLTLSYMMSQLSLAQRVRSFRGANPTPSPSPCRGGVQFSPFPRREGGRGVRSSG